MGMSPGQYRTSAELGRWASLSTQRQSITYLKWQEVSLRIPCYISVIQMDQVDHPKQRVAWPLKLRFEPPRWGDSFPNRRCWWSASHHQAGVWYANDLFGYASFVWRNSCHRRMQYISRFGVANLDMYLIRFLLLAYLNHLHIFTSTIIINI